jgi:hypothetical protein
MAGPKPTNPKRDLSNTGRKIGRPVRAKIRLEGGEVICDFLAFSPIRYADDIAVYSIADHVHGTEVYNKVRDELQTEIFRLYKEQQ